jgi:predicted phosphodiesterase
MSDLHARVPLDWMASERRQLIRVQKPMRERVLGVKLDKALAEITQDAPIDLFCFTGDVADWGLEQEYDQADRVLGRILTKLEIEPSRFFVVPGNHDVNRKLQEDAWRDMRKALSEREDINHHLGRWAFEAGAPAAIDAGLLAKVLERQGPYWAWIKQKLRRLELVPGATDMNHPTLGYRVTLDLKKFPFPIHVIGINSAWLAGDEHDKGKLFVTREQIDGLAHGDGEPLRGFRLALMHHSLSDLVDWDATEVRRALSDTTDLLLHGHQHDQDLQTRLDPDRALTIIAAGSIYEGDKGDRYFNSWHVIDVTLDDEGRPSGCDFTFYGWSERGHWHRTDALYGTSRDGKLSWSGAKPPEDRASGPGSGLASGPLFAQALRNAWHPSWDLDNRGPLTPCRFRINLNFASDGESRWEKYGDVLVTLDHPPTADDVYLVPSRKSPKRFEAPKNLKNKAHREPKKQLIARFAKSVGTRELDGYWFTKTMAKDGRPRVQVYAMELDAYLTANATTPERDLVYVSYKTTDDEWRLRLRELLDADTRIPVWDDSKLAASSDYLAVMQEAMRRAKVVVVLASAEYLASPMPTTHELAPAIAAADVGELRLLWVPVRAFDFSGSPLGRFMAAVNPGVGLAEMTPAESRNAVYALYAAICHAFGLEPRPKKPPSIGWNTFQI